MLFVSCFVFLELGYRVKKQFLKHLPLLGISGDFEHGPVVLNVLLIDKALHQHLRSSAALS